MDETSIIGMYILNKVHVKSTPFKKPKNKGGSPTGVNEPPIFDTKNIKNTIKWTLFFLHELARINGLIRSIEAPVVPIIDARIVPINIIDRFKVGDPFKLPVISIPPETVNKANNRTINGRNSLRYTSKI